MLGTVISARDTRINKLAKAWVYIEHRLNTNYNILWIWGTNGKCWNKDKGNIVVKMPLKEVLAVYKWVKNICPVICKHAQSWVFSYLEM